MWEGLQHLSRISFPRDYGRFPALGRIAHKSGLYQQTAPANIHYLVYRVQRGFAGYPSLSQQNPFSLPSVTNASRCYTLGGGFLLECREWFAATMKPAAPGSRIYLQLWLQVSGYDLRLGQLKFGGTTWL